MDKYQLVDLLDNEQNRGRDWKWKDPIVTGIANAPDPSIRISGARMYGATIDALADRLESGSAVMPDVDLVARLRDLAGLLWESAN